MLYGNSLLAALGIIFLAVYIIVITWGYLSNKKNKNDFSHGNKYQQ
jgi:hypothetical protein